jgi:hypothetical protein
LHPGSGRAQCSVGSIEDDGIRYGLATSVLTKSTSASAKAIVTSQSISTLYPRGMPSVRRSIG